MPCSISSGVVRDCEFFLAGLKETSIYLGNFTNFTFAKNSGGTVTGITASPSGSTFYSFEANPETASYTVEELKGAGGNKYLQTTFTFKTDSDSVATTAAMKQLGLAKVVAIVTTKRGERVVLGSENGLDALVVFNSGAASGDEAGWTVTMTTTETEFQLPLGTGVSVPV